MAIKSSYELAMERLAQRGGKSVLLSDSQKQAIAEVETKAKAKIAELEIMTHASLAKAIGDDKAMETIKDGQRSEVEKIKARAEAEKESIRQSAAS